MISTSNTSSVELSSVISPNLEYEVFLSFRGPDTGAGFTDHLYRKLIDANIKVYRDDEELEKGGEIGPNLLQAINNSTIAIPIFSKRYAESKWCLKELVEINNCRRSTSMKVMPICYHVTPSEVRNQRGSFEAALGSHDQEHDNIIIKKSKEALNEIGSLSGWEIPSKTYSLEGKLVEDVTKEIALALKNACVKIPDHLVGLGCHVENLLEMLSLEKLGVRIIGIYGMGGIGKTTLAKFVYNHLLSNFDDSLFIEDARSKDIEDLRTKLKYDKKVLLVIDDVDEKTQMGDLIGKQGKHFFASKSRIILTTRNESVRRCVQVDESYELNGMDDVHSLQLFCRHAFGRDKPEVDYDILSKQIVEITGGLPLALEVIGSSLRNRSNQEWEYMLEKLKDVPAKEVNQKLRISYDELDERQKHIFLDIACFFIWWDLKTVIHFWDPRKFYPTEAINVLQQKSLVKVRNDLLWMHNQLRDLGREIVREGNIMEPEKQTRLWNKEEAIEVFMTKKATKKIQGIHVGLTKKSCLYFTEEEFAKLSKVRLFWLDSTYGHDCDWSSWAAPSYFPQKNPHIFSEVRWLSWPSFPYEYIEIRNFSFLNLTILNLSKSSFTIDWDGWSQIKMAKNLKVLDLTSCSNLVKTPEFSSNQLLERLDLHYCDNLVEIDKSIGMLEHLVYLNLQACTSLCQLPAELNCLESLTELLLDYTGIVEIPQQHDGSICMTALEKLSLEHTKITSFPYSFGKLVHLSELDLRGCDSLKELPESIGGLVSLIEIDISSSGIQELPNSIGCLKNLKRLGMSHTLIKELPTTIEMAAKLEEINASYCENLIGLPKLPGSIINLKLPYKTMVRIPDLSNLIQLECLVMDGPEPDVEWTRVEMPSPSWIGSLSKVERLDLSFPTITTLHPDLGALSLLTQLNIDKCYQLQSIPKLPSNLRKLEVRDCKLLETMYNLSHLKKLSTLNINKCDKLQSIPMLPSNLTELEVIDCEVMKTISNLSHLKMLSSLKISFAPLINLVDVHGLESLRRLTLEGCDIFEIVGMPENLRQLSISDCWSLKRLPQMSKYKKLVDLYLFNCGNVVEIDGRLESIGSLCIYDCGSLVKIPDVLDVKNLYQLDIAGCDQLCHGGIYRSSPILTNNTLLTESERSFMSTMFKICGYSKNTANENEEGEGKGKKRTEVR